MTHLSLFSGIGGADLAAEWAGFTTVAFCEKDNFCQQVLAKHWPNTPIYEDIKTFSGNPFRGVTLLTGGFPCQPFSKAGKRKGAGDDRALWPEMLRVIRESEPTWVIGENVAGILSMLEFEETVASLENEGYEVQAIALPACGVGAPHKRERVFILAHSKDGKQSEFQTSDNGRTQRREAQKRFELGSGGRSEGWDIAEGIKVNGGITRSVSPNVPVPERWRSDPTGDLWNSEPDVDRMAHGLPGRTHRLRALGNAIVPQQIYPILKAIAEIERGQL